MDTYLRMTVLLPRHYDAKFVAERRALEELARKEGWVPCGLSVSAEDTPTMTFQKAMPWTDAVALVDGVIQGDRQWASDFVHKNFDVASMTISNQSEAD